MVKKSKKVRSTKVLKNANYAVSGAGRSGAKVKAVSAHYDKQDKASNKSAANAKKMAKIEAYAKEHNISITQAMIHFM